MTLEKRYAAAWLCSLFAGALLLALPITALADEDPAPGADTAPAATQEAAAADSVTADDAACENAGEEAGADPAEAVEDPAAPAEEPATADAEPAAVAETPSDEPAPAQEPAAGQPEDAQPADGEAAGGEPAAPEAPGAGATEALDEPAPAAEDAVKAAAPAAATTKAAASVPAAPTAAAPAKATSTKKVAKAKAAKKASAKGGPISNGTYVLNLAKSTKLMLSVMKAKGTAKAVFKADDNSTKQRWILTWVKKAKAYTIKNASSKLLLTTNSKSAGKELVWQKSGKGTSKMQLWKLSKSGDAYRILSAANSNIGLGTWSGELKDGFYATVQSKAANKYLFYILPAGNDASKRPSAVKDDIDTSKTYSIKLASKTSLAADIKGESQDNGANAALATSTDSTSQKWRFVQLGNGLYQLVDVNTNRALAMQGGKRGVGTAVVQAARNKKNQAQQWWVSQAKGGSYIFTNRLNGLVMKAAKAKAGAELKAGLVNASTSVKAYKVSETDLISAGYYTIAQRSKPQKVLQTPSKVSTGKTQLKLASLEGDLDRKYRISKDADGNLRVFSIASGTYLADNGAGKGVLAAKSDADTQLWQAVWNGTSVSLRNVGTKKLLGISGSASVASRSSVGSAERLVLTKGNLIDDGAYFIDAFGSDAILEVKDESKKTGANVRLAKNQDAQGQKFKITHISGDLYKIVNANSGKVVAVASSADGANVNQKKYLGSNSQKWIVTVSEKGGIQFLNKESGKAITVAGSAKAGTNVNAKANKESAKQRWLLTATTAYDKVQMLALSKAQKYDSSSNKYVTVDKIAHRVIVWTRNSKTDKWTLKFDWPCIIGKPSTPTPEGNFKFTGGYYTNADPRHDCFSAYYYRHIHSGTYFHTLLKRPFSGPNGPVLHDNKFGTNVSGGCCRLAVENAKWIYSQKNIPRGTGLSVYSY